MSLLIQLTIILAFALVLVPTTKALGLPSLLGYVMTGMLLGPFALDLVDMSLELKHIQNIGMLCLLFLIGMQLQPARLLKMTAKNVQLPVAAVLIFIAVATIVGVLALDLAVLPSLVISSALSLASVTLLPQLKSQLPQTLQHQLSQFALVHSLIGALFIALLPLSQMLSPQHGLAYVMSLVAAITGLYLLQRYLLEPVFDFLARSKTQELIFASAIFTASLSFIVLNALGIHPTLAALLAGFLISDSRCHSNLNHSFKPLYGLVFAAFFIVLGLSLPLQLIIAMPMFFALGLIALFLLKGLLYFALSRYFQATWHNNISTASALLGSGELGLIVLYVAFEQHISTASVLEPYLMLLMLSFLLSPCVFIGIQRYVLPRIPDQQHTLATPIHTPLLIIGFGRFGQLVARIAHLQQTPFIAIDSHVQGELELERYGGSLHLLDATDASQFEQLDLRTVQVAVLAVDDVEDNLNIVRYLQLHHPEIELFVRARDRHHAHLLRDLGIQHIWRETYLSALELAEQSLAHLHQSTNATVPTVADFRLHDQQLQRQQQQIEYDDTKLYQTQTATLDELAYLFAQDAEFKAKYAAQFQHHCTLQTSQQMKPNDL